MSQKYSATLTHHPAHHGQGLSGPGFWYIILICYPHVTHTIAPAPLLLCEPEHYALTSDKVSQRDILIWHL